MGSASELEYHFLLAKDLDYVKPDVYESLNRAVVEIKRLIAALLSRVDEERSRKQAAGQ